MTFKSFSCNNITDSLRVNSGLKNSTCLFKLTANFEGVGKVAVVSELKAAGVKTAVGSSKPELFINRILEHFGISDLFDFVSGATFGEPHADKTVIINRAVNGLGVDNLADAVMVGDRSFDIDGAHGVGLKCIGVLEGGYGDENEFKTAGADWIVDTLADVKDIILK